MQIGLIHYLTVAAALFGFGLFCVMTRRHAVGILLGRRIDPERRGSELRGLRALHFRRHFRTGLHGVYHHPGR